jgi:hypothetical protein
MKTRHLGKALAGLAATAAAIGLLGLPASAHTVTSAAEITGGSLAVINADGSTLTTQTLGTGGTGTPCTTPPSSATMTMTDVPHPNSTTGTWTFISTSCTCIQIGTQKFISLLTITFHPSNGTWVGTYSGSTLTGTGGTASAVLRKATATCVAIGGPCTIAVSDISVSGTHTVSPTPDIALGDTANVSGGTNAEGDLGFEVAVTGTATDCGSLIGADDGAVTFTNVTILAI